VREIGGLGSFTHCGLLDFFLYLYVFFKQRQWDTNLVSFEKSAGLPHKRESQAGESRQIKPPDYTWEEREVSPH
jgi:hypothetical protein